MANVLLTNAEGRWAVAACRGLAAAGHRVTAVARLTPAPTHWSRFCSQRLTMPDPNRDVAAFIDGLEELLRSDRHDVLLPTAESSLRAISELRERIEPHVAIGLPPHHVVLSALDKVDLIDAARRVGLTPPPSAVCSSDGEAREAARDMGFPLIVKSGRSLVERTAGGLRRQSSVLVSNASQLETAVAKMGPSFVVQRYETRPSIVSLGGVATDDGLLAVAVSRYVRTWPPLAGSASFSTTIDPPKPLVSAADEFVRQFGFTGIFEMELIEQRTGEFSMIDFNPRLYGSVALAIASGANLPALWCDWLLRRNPCGAVGAPGWSYRWEEGEAKNLIQCLKRRDVRGARSIAMPRRRVVHPLFRPTDPGPLVASIARARVARRRAA